MWIDVELDELKAVIEAAEAGQRTGKLKRSAKNLDKGLSALRTCAQGEEQLHQRYQEKVRAEKGARS